MADANSGFAQSLTNDRLAPVVELLTDMNIPSVKYPSSVTLLRTTNSVRTSASIRLKEDKFFIEAAKHKLGFKSQRLINSYSKLVNFEDLKTNLEQLTNTPN
jgi:hypothetical protein